MTLPPGTIDLHLHAAPDGGARRVDALALARGGRLSGALFKCHHAPTAAVAALCRQEVPGFAALGAVVLNHAAGGLNPAAIEALAQVGGAAARVVFLPTRDAANDLARKGRSGHAVAVTSGGRALPAVFAVAEAVAARGLVLASGHLAPAETAAVFAALAGRGMALLATHVTAPVTPFAPAELASVLAAGALAEISARNLLQHRPDRADPDPDRVAAAAALVRRHGADRFVLTGDLGAAGWPDPVDGLAAAAAALGRAGISDAGLEMMLVTNPRALAAAPTGGVRR